jgi:hypothetical protein
VPFLVFAIAISHSVQIAHAFKEELCEERGSYSSRYAAKHNTAELKFQLASGNVGIAAARNEVVSAAQTQMLLLVYAAVSLLVLLAFRSFRAVLCVIFPLSLVSILCYALMSWLEIGLTLSTLPVAALGVGVGTWYFSTLQFQADMGILLAFMFVANMIAALVLIPILARLTGLYGPEENRPGKNS